MMRAKGLTHLWEVCIHHGMLGIVSAMNGSSSLFILRAGGRQWSLRSDR